MTRRLALLLFVIMAAGLGGTSLDAADAGPAQRRRLPPGAALLGQVVDAHSGRGLDRVIVALDGGGLQRRILSDTRGRFLLDGLPAGEYRITATRVGFLDGAFGQRRPAGSASTITLMDGQWIGNIEVRLWRPAVLTGFVTDLGGVPIAGITVRAYRQHLRPGGTALREVALAITDDTGAYRLSSLLPGTHVVGVSSQHIAVTTDIDDTDDRADTISEVVSAHEPELIFPPIYFPNAESAIAASLVTVESGREFTGVNFYLPGLPVLEVSGRVDPASVPEGKMGFVRLLLARPLDPFVAESPTHRYLGGVSPDANGYFTFAQVPSGHYVIEATLVSDDAESPGRFWASERVSLDQTSNADVSMILQPGLNLEGRTRMIVSAGRDAALPAQLTIGLEPLFEAPGIRPQVWASDETGTFRTGPVLLPGRYLVRVGGIPPGWRLRAVMAGGIDVSDEGLDLSSGFVPTDLQIDLTSELTLITGTVRGLGPLADATATVLLFPQQDGLIGARRYHSVRCSFDGTFSLPNVPAGTYLIVAVDDAETDGWQDPGRLAVLRRNATPVTVREGEAKVLELRRTGKR